MGLFDNNRQSVDDDIDFDLDMDSGPGLDDIKQVASGSETGHIKNTEESSLEDDSLDIDVDILDGLFDGVEEEVQDNNDKGAIYSSAFEYESSGYGLDTQPSSDSGLGTGEDTDIQEAIQEDSSYTDGIENEQLDLSSLMETYDTDSDDEKGVNSGSNETFTIEKLRQLRNNQSSTNDEFRYEEEEVEERGNIGEVASDVKNSIKNAKKKIKEGNIKQQNKVVKDTKRYIVSTAISVLSALIILAGIKVIINKAFGNRSTVIKITAEDKENIKMFNSVVDNIKSSNFYAQILVDNDGSYGNYFHNKEDESVMQYGESMNIVYGSDGTIVKQDIQSGECGVYSEPSIVQVIYGMAGLVNSNNAIIEIVELDDLLKDKYIITVKGNDNIKKLLKGFSKDYRNMVAGSISSDMDNVSISLSLVWQSGVSGMEAKLELADGSTTKTLWYTDTVMEFSEWSIDESFYKKSNKDAVDKTTSNLEEAVAEYNK